MTSRTALGRILTILGSIAMLVGVLDPLEGSVIILLGSGMVLCGTVLNRSAASVLRYWLLVFILIIVGVGVLFALSAVGGFGGSTGRSIWWALSILPYSIGWLLGFIGIVRLLAEFIRTRQQKAATL